MIVSTLTSHCPKLHVALRRWNVRLTQHLLTVSASNQSMSWWEQLPASSSRPLLCNHRARAHYRISTSRYGLGQVENSLQTPLGLHRVARKIGAFQPIGTVFQHRQPIGFTWDGFPDASIIHRILWLEGLEPGLNRGGDVDTFRRYVYIHGYADESTLGRPKSRGCVHMAAADLLPLFDRLPVGTLVWIQP